MVIGESFCIYIFEILKSVVQSTELLDNTRMDLLYSEIHSVIIIAKAHLAVLISETGSLNSSGGHRY